MDELKDVCSEYFWVFCNTNGIGHDGDDITTKDSCIDLDRALWFMMGRSMWKNHHNMFDQKTLCKE